MPFWDQKCGLVHCFSALFHFSSTQGCTNRCSLAAGLRGNGERMRKWRGNGERMRKWREIHSQDFLILCLFPPSLSISYIKNCHILSQNVKYGTFVANVTKNLTYALWGNNSGSNSLRGSSASCAGLALALFDISIWHIDCRYIDTFEKYRYRYRYRYGHIWKYRYRYRYR